MKLLDRLRNDTPKPFLEHLEDLRWVFIKMAVALVVAMGFSLVFQKTLVRVLAAPLAKIDPELISKLWDPSPVGPITIVFSMAFYAGIVFAFPLLLFFAAQFIVPALSQKEKKVIIPAILASFMLFASGVIICYYFILPGALKFLYAYSKSLQFTPNWTVREYFSFASQMLLCVGAAFQLPVIVLTLVYVRVLSVARLRSTRPYAYVLILLMAAIIAPTPDPITFLSLGIPLCLIYEACIWSGWAMEKRRAPDA